MLLILAFICFGGASLFCAELVPQPARQRAASLRRIRRTAPRRAARAAVARGHRGDRYASGLARVALRLDPRQTADRDRHPARQRRPGTTAGRRRGSWPRRSFWREPGVIAGGLIGASLGRYGWAIVAAVGLRRARLLLPGHPGAQPHRQAARGDPARDARCARRPRGQRRGRARLRPGLSRLHEHMTGPLVEEFQLVLARAPRRREPRQRAAQDGGPGRRGGGERRSCTR